MINLREFGGFVLEQFWHKTADLQHNIGFLVKGSAQILKIYYPLRMRVIVRMLGLGAILILAAFGRARAAGPADAMISIAPPSAWGSLAAIPAQLGVASPNQQNAATDLGLGLFLGWYLLLAGYSLLVWMVRRERAGLYLSVSLIVTLLGILSANRLQGFSSGLLPLSLSLEWDRWLSLPGIFWVAVIVVFTILFVQSLVTAGRLPGWLNRLVAPIIGVWALVGIASIWEPLRISLAVLAGLAMITVLLLIVMAFSGLATGYRPAAYVIIGLVLTLVGWIVGFATGSRLEAVLPGVSLLLMTLLFAAALYDQQLFMQANLERSFFSLRDNETRLRQYLEALPFSAAVVGPDSGLLWTNRRFTSLFASLDPAEKFPASLKELFYLYPLYRAGTTELYPLKQFPSSSALQGRSARIDDVELEREEGRFPLEIWAEPLLDQHQHAAAALIVCQDICARRQAEQELARHVQDLQLMVDLRLEELRYEHEDRKKVENVLHRLATTDPLTGLLNRRHWSSLADRYLQQAARYRHQLSLILMDIDHFKYVNDIYGHRTGDETLIRISAIIRDTLRNVDLLARYGGDEFVVLLPDTDQAGAEVVAERLRDRVANLMVEGSKGPVAVTLSIGLANVRSGEYLRIEEFIEQADLALYGAKHSGRNRVMAYAPMEVN